MTEGHLGPGRAVYPSFDDDTLAGLDADQLGFSLEEYDRRHSELRGRERFSRLVVDRDAATRTDVPGVAVQPACEWLLEAPDP